MIPALLLILFTGIASAQYDRRDWPHWVDADRDCQNTRQEVLIAESLIAPKLDAAGCRVLSGLWFDPYSGKTHTDPRRLDVDHVVPLREAYKSGGQAWTRERRRDFANSLDGLVATASNLNRQKGARRPDEWKPPNPRTWCRYARLWLGVKHRWGLSVANAEMAAILDMLGTCCLRLAPLSVAALAPATGASGDAVTLPDLAARAGFALGGLRLAVEGCDLHGC